MTASSEKEGAGSRGAQGAWVHTEVVSVGPGRVTGIMPESEEEETGPHNLLPHSGCLRFAEVLGGAQSFFYPGGHLRDSGRGVQTLGVSEPHWKTKSCLGPHIKYTNTNKNFKIS